MIEENGMKFLVANSPSNIFSGLTSNSDGLTYNLFALQEGEEFGPGFGLTAEDAPDH